jgi:hypothetical protein
MVRGIQEKDGRGVRRLSIGGVKPGMICVDPYDCRARVRRPAWDTGLDGKFDWIEMIHCLEHIPSAMVMLTLVEMKRLLASDGTLLVMVPDIASAMKEWLERPTFPPPAAIYGSQTREGQFHQTCFSPETLTLCLEQAGFSVTSVEMVTRKGRRVLDGEPGPEFMHRTRGIREGILVQATHRPKCERRKTSLHVASREAIEER